MALPRVGLALRANVAASTFLLANHTLANQSPHALRTLYSTQHSAPHVCTFTRAAGRFALLHPPRPHAVPTHLFAILPFPFSLLPMPKPDKNDIERLSRGESTRGKIGNRGVGHRLTQKERILFEAAKRNGFLKIPVTGIRKNVLNVYRLWCQATDREFITK